MAENWADSEGIRDAVEFFSESGKARIEARRLLHELDPDVVQAFWDVSFENWAQSSQLLGMIMSIELAKWRDAHPGELPGKELLPELSKSLKEFDINVSFGPETVTEDGSSLAASLHLDNEQESHAVMDMIKSIITDDTDMLIKYIVVLARTWAKKHPSRHVMTDLIVPASRILGDMLGFGVMAPDPERMTREKAEKVEEYIERLSKGDEDNGEADE